MTIRAIFIPIIRTLTYYCLPSRLLRVTLLSVINLFVCNYQFATLANTARNILFFSDARRSKQPFVKSFSLIGRCPPQMIRKIVKSFVSLSLSRHLDYRTIYLSFRAFEISRAFFTKFEPE